MNAKRFRTNRHNFYVPLGLLFGLVVIAGLALTTAMPVLGQDHVGLICTPPPSGMLGWWPGEGNAKDITPHDHDGTLHGATFTSGEVGQAFSLDGVDDFVSVPNAPDLNIPSGKITVDAWIYPTAVGQFYPSILGKGNVGNFQESYALFLNPDNTIGFLVNTDGTATGRAIVFGVTPILTNTWTLVAGTYDGTSVKVYLNGLLDGTAPHIGTTINGTPNDLLIGKADRSTPNPSTFSDSYFNGRIDEAELFNQALSAADIANLHKAGSAGKCKCQEKPDEADGDIQNDDTSKSHVKMTAKRNCDDNGEVDYKDDSGEEMRGNNKSVATSRNTAMVSGQGNLLDGTPVYYTIVMVGNQPLIGLNLFSITWTTPAGSFFHRSGVMLDGLISVPLP
jgi:Concanavalin A-like lectin/glucanases superfamily